MAVGFVLERSQGVLTTATVLPYAATVVGVVPRHAKPVIAGGP